jgi:hypothetical protein
MRVDIKTRKTQMLLDMQKCTSDFKVSSEIKDKDTGYIKEVITIPNEYIEKKMAFYEKNYSENLKHNMNSDVRITGWDYYQKDHESDIKELAEQIDMMHDYMKTEKFYYSTKECKFAMYVKMHLLLYNIQQKGIELEENSIYLTKKFWD